MKITLIFLLGITLAHSFEWRRIRGQERFVSLGLTRLSKNPRSHKWIPSRKFVPLNDVRNGLDDDSSILYGKFRAENVYVNDMNLDIEYKVEKFKVSLKFILKSF